MRPEHQKYVAWQRNSLTCLHFIWIGGYISGHCIDHTNGFAHIFCHCDFPLVFLFCCSFFLFGWLCGKKQRSNNNFLLPQVNEFLNLRVILLYFGLSLHFSWISHQFPTDLKPFSCFIILWIQFDRNFILNFCIKPKKNKCISLKTYLVQKIGSSEYETHSVLNDSVSVCLMWPCTMNIWSQFVNIWITVKIAVFMYLEKKNEK